MKLFIWTYNYENAIIACADSLENAILLAIQENPYIGHVIVKEIPQIHEIPCAVSI